MNIAPHWVDQQPVPEWGTGPDGRAVRIADDERLPDLHREWLADACDHPEPAIIKRTTSNGSTIYNHFCRHCGAKGSNQLPYASVEGRIVSPIENDEIAVIADRYTKERREVLDKIASDAAERMQPINRTAYDDYLRSDEWKRRAAKIMERANGLCEGCLSRPASQVHHLTYAHRYREFAFELVALCDGCHKRIHEPEVA